MSRDHGLVTKKKIPAHDRWVCFDCRWTAKFPLIDARAADRPSYDCPKCKKHMVWTGTAFRPPRRDDDEGWQVAEQVMAAGFRYRTTSQRQRFPKTLDELKTWVKEQKKGDAWLPERKLAVARERDGRLTFRAGQRILSGGERVLIYHDGGWHEGRVSGYVVTLSSRRKSVPITPRTRLRTRRRGEFQQ